MHKIILFLGLMLGTIANGQVFRFVVAQDGSGTDLTLQSAIDKCPENARSIIFIKKGTYYGPTTIGNKTTPGNKWISLIGEDRENVILSYDKSLPMVTKFEEATTFQVYSKDFYAENITFANTAGNTGQALAVYTAGDKAVFKNCNLKGYQDTYRSKKGTRGYFKDCLIEGAVDFVYAGGIIFFDDCEIRCIKGGGYITAPEDAYQTIPKTQTVCQRFLRLGFIFRNCNITAEAGVADGSYFLGRPWNTMAGSFYLNCTLGKHINSKGWKEWGGNETSACFAEYKSKTPEGNLVDTTARVSWSFQLPQADVENLLSTTGVYARASSEVFAPEPVCIKPSAPQQLKNTEAGIVWNKVVNASGYMILKADAYLTTTTDTFYVDMTAGPGAISIKTIGNYGQLSDAAKIVSGIHNPQDEFFRIIVQPGIISIEYPVKMKIYNLSGELIQSFPTPETSFKINLPEGIYILRMISQEKKEITRKLIYTHKKSE